METSDSVGRGWSRLGYGSDYNIIDDDTVLVRGAVAAEEAAAEACSDFAVGETLDRIRGGHWLPEATFDEGQSGLQVIQTWKRQFKPTHEKAGGDDSAT
jgi:hypothetical protein